MDYLGKGIGIPILLGVLAFGCRCCMHGVKSCYSLGLPPTSMHVYTQILCKGARDQSRWVRVELGGMCQGA